MITLKMKRGLGRGLSSLIGDTDTNSSKNKLSISSIVRNKFQPRKVFDKESLDELTNSIRERGMIQPIVVRKSQDKDDNPLPKPLLILNATIMQHSQMIFLD